MVVRSALLLALLAFSLTAGCLDDQSGLSADSLDGIPTGSAPEGANAGTPADHGNHARQESAVTVTRQNDQYVAAKTITLSNDFGGAANADVKLTTVVGGVSFDDWGEGGYQVVAKLTARATTEQAARDNLARLKVVHNDRLGAGRLTLDTTVQFPTNVQGLGGSLEASLPATPAYRLTGTTDTGGAKVSGLGGPSVALSADTGGVEARGAFNTANLQTDTGGVALDGIFNDVQAHTDTGGIDADIEPTSSGSIELETDTGGVQLRLRTGSGYGYDVEADVGTGGINIALGQTTAIGSQDREHKHVQTANYDEAEIQVTVVLSADTGGVTVTG